MASLPPLLSYLDELVASAEDIDLETPVSLALVNTLEALNTPSSSRPPPLRPVELANALVASSPTRRRLLANSDQQDAHELWVMMRDAVEEEAVRLSEALRRLASRGSGLKEVARMQAGLGLAVGTKVQRRAATDPFFWLRSQRVRCMECGYVRDTRHEGEELLMLSVPPIVNPNRMQRVGTSADVSPVDSHTARYTTCSPSTPRRTSFLPTIAVAAPSSQL